MSGEEGEKKKELSATAAEEAKAMERLGGADEQEDKVDPAKVREAMKELVQKNETARQMRLLEAQKLAGVPVTDEDVKLVANELLLSEADAREKLQRNGGDVEATLTAFIAS